LLTTGSHRGTGAVPRGFSAISASGSKLQVRLGWNRIVVRRFIV
jgi:hypothetical protein